MSRGVCFSGGYRCLGVNLVLYFLDQGLKVQCWAILIVNILLHCCIYHCLIHVPESNLPFLGSYIFQAYTCTNFDLCWQTLGYFQMGLLAHLPNIAHKMRNYKNFCCRSAGDVVLSKAVRIGKNILCSITNTLKFK